MNRKDWFAIKQLIAAVIFLGLIPALSQTLLCAEEEIIDPDTRGVHDPTMIYTGEYAYVYCTGSRLSIRRSSDLMEWDYLGRVFSSIPAWIQSQVPGVSGLWAPDVTYHNGKYYLCYSASTFGHNTSLIALASNVTLDPADPDYNWIDEGEIVSSTGGVSNYNAIDGTFVRDNNGDMWLVFGSFWTGIKLTPLNNTTLKPTTSPPTLYSIASRSSTAIEASYITYRNGYYYLFVNFDTCCQGVDSTYKIMVGRSTSITGPYLDKNGFSMMVGGGTLFVGTDGRWIGPGHATITEVEGQQYFSYHAYDGLDNGTATLRINELSWDQSGWPVLGDPVVIVPPDGPVIAHWNFEDGTAGEPMNDTGTDGQMGTMDVSGNGFDMYADTSGPSFSAEGQTPTGFGLSARFDGAQDGYTKSTYINAWSPTEWTIELAVKLDTLTGWQTMIGRDGASHGEAEADFYFQKNDDNDRFRLNFETVGGRRYILDADFTVVPGQWYYLAGVCDGDTLTMYADKLDGSGSPIVCTPLSLNAANDNALAASDEAWTFGRGWFNGNSVDQIQGNLDRIRFTNRALTPSEFLNYQCGAWGYLENDLNFNCRVELSDFALIAADWDGTLDGLEQLAMQWLGTTQPFAEDAVHGTAGGPGQ